MAATLLAASLVLQACSSEEISSSVKESEDTTRVQKSLYEPALSPSFDTPWPTVVSRKDMIETSLFKANEYLEKLPKKTCKRSAKVFLGEPMLPEHQELAQRISDGMVNTFCDYLNEDLTVIGGSYDFVKETVAAEELPSDDFGGVCGYPVQGDFASACAFKGTAWIGVQLGTLRRGQISTEERRVSIAAHELFHLVHDSIDPGPAGQSPPPGHPFFRPVWLIEGAGEYFGRLMPFHFGIQEYWTFTPTDRSGAYLPVEYLSDLKNLEISQRLAFGTENYYSGQVAMEYITASVGLEALLDVWVRMGQGDKFAIAFEKAVGISVKDFYQKFAEMHDNLYPSELVQ